MEAGANQACGFLYWQQISSYQHMHVRKTGRTNGSPFKTRSIVAAITIFKL